ncbi:MAG TPA: transketolase [Bacteroidia bacterium]|nr:transketolase [Bacteroidia bacterium]
MKLATIPEMQEMADQVRRDILRMVHAVQSGHPGGSMGCTEFFISLYFNHLRHDPKTWTMDGKGQDLFFLSNGHISPVWYSVLARSGYFSVEELATFRKINSRLQGHPGTKEGLPGVRVASGSLGQGMSVAIGAAQAKKLNGDKHIIYTLHGDGELQEGQIWEAVIYAAAKKVDNMICTIDRNMQQIDGPTENVMSLGDLRPKFEAFGWLVLEMNGHYYVDVLNTLETARRATYRGKPIAIIMHTDMGRGVDFMQGTHEWHGKAPNDEQFARAMAQIPVTRFLDY